MFSIPIRPNWCSAKQRSCLWSVKTFKWANGNLKGFDKQKQVKDRGRRASEGYRGISADPWNCHWCVNVSRYGLSALCTNSSLCWFLLTIAGLHTGPSLGSSFNGKTVCEHIQVGNHTLSLFVCPCLPQFSPQECLQTWHFQKYMKLVINLTGAGFCELSYPGPVTHASLIHHCWQKLVSFRSSSPFCPPPFIHLSLLPSLLRLGGQVAYTGSWETICLIVFPHHCPSLHFPSHRGLHDEQQPDVLFEWLGATPTWGDCALCRAARYKCMLTLTKKQPFSFSPLICFVCDCSAGDDVTAGILGISWGTCSHKRISSFTGD